MGTVRIDNKRGSKNPDKEPEEVKEFLPTKGKGVTEQIPAHAYGPPVMRWQDSWSPQTLYHRMQTVDRKRA